MAAEKCFCHLNGYAVKDATARAEIENIKAEIKELDSEHIGILSEHVNAIGDMVDTHERDVTGLKAKLNETNAAVINMESKLGDVDLAQLESDIISHDARLTELEQPIKIYAHKVLGRAIVASGQAYFRFKWVFFSSKNTPLFGTGDKTIIPSNLLASLAANSTIYELRVGEILKTFTGITHVESSRYFALNYIRTIDVTTGTITADTLSIPENGFNITEYIVDEV